ncbi:uncharacterized protein LOC133193267 [Saccostrea echinata]|uniref:uncharacterized protein LOC133193267 n=1 Tax=Saccostrea echinata TaxID=191078 RepID=UPI002A82FB09|nr:uncharacterized protein LOC133193267 [Saccostrea echinata]
MGVYGLHKTPEKIYAIVKAPSPTNVSQLRSFLSLVNYYGKFLSDLETVLRPLHHLLQKDSHWKLTEACEESFKKMEDLVHDGHLGVVKMEMLVRSFCWRQGIDKDIEKVAKRCQGCQQNQNAPKGAPLNA